MSKLIESLKRLYQAGKITENKIRNLRETETLTWTEIEYILGRSVSPELPNMIPEEVD